MNYSIIVSHLYDIHIMYIDLYKTVAGNTHIMRYTAVMHVLGILPSEA